MDPEKLKKLEEQEAEVRSNGHNWSTLQVQKMTRAPLLARLLLIICRMKLQNQVHERRKTKHMTKTRALKRNSAGPTGGAGGRGGRGARSSRGGDGGGGGRGPMRARALTTGMVCTERTGGQGSDLNDTEEGTNEGKPGANFSRAPSVVTEEDEEELEEEEAEEEELQELPQDKKVQEVQDEEEGGEEAATEQRPSARDAAVRVPSLMYKTLHVCW